MSGVLESGRVVRDSSFGELLGESSKALNRQRIMEIKARRLANGTIMANDTVGHAGHANQFLPIWNSAEINP